MSRSFRVASVWTTLGRWGSVPTYLYTSHYTDPDCVPSPPELNNSLLQLNGITLISVTHLNFNCYLQPLSNISAVTPDVTSCFAFLHLLNSLISTLLFRSLTRLTPQLSSHLQCQSLRKSLFHSNSSNQQLFRSEGGATTSLISLSIQDHHILPGCSSLLLFPTTSFPCLTIRLTALNKLPLKKCLTVYNSFMPNSLNNSKYSLAELQQPSLHISSSDYIPSCLPRSLTCSMKSCTSHVSADTASNLLHGIPMAPRSHGAPSRPFVRPQTCSAASVMQSRKPLDHRTSTELSTDRTVFLLTSIRFQPASLRLILHVPPLSDLPDL